MADEPVTPPVVDPAAPATPPAAAVTPPVAPPVAPAADPAKPASVLGGDPAAVAPNAPNSTWPDDWRTRAALGDDKRAKRYETYASPEDLFKAHAAAVARIEAGEAAAPLPEKPTPEQLSTYRQKHGIPETPDKYDLTLPGGLVIGENDKPMVDDYLKLAHERNLPPTVVKDTVGWFFQQIEAQKEARLELDADLAEKTQEALRADFGADYKTNINVVDGWIDTLPEAKRDLFRYGRLADGTPIGADPDVLKWMVGQARQINPISTIVPQMAEGQPVAFDAELADLKKEAANPRSAYWIGGEATKKQARMGVLLEAIARQKGKAA